MASEADWARQNQLQHIRGDEYTVTSMKRTHKILLKTLNMM